MRRTLAGADFDFDFAMTYDNLNRMASQRLPDGRQLDYHRDTAGRVVAVDGIVESVTYRNLDRVDEAVLANGVREAWDYDVLQRAIRREVTDANGAAVLDLSYVLRRGAQIERIEDAAPSAGDPGLGVAYTYDALYQVTTAILDPGRVDFEEHLDYAYDDLRRLVSKTSSRAAASPAHLGALIYGEDAGPHAVTTAGGDSIHYDAAGYISQRGDLDLEWDPRGRLARAGRGDETIAVAAYDSGDERLLLREGPHTLWTLSRGFEIEDGMALAHIELGGRKIATVESAGLATQVLSDLAPADGIDDEITAADAVVARAIAAGEANAPNGVDPSDVESLLASSVRRQILEGEARLTFNHHDHCGNTVAVTNADGIVIDRQAYYPFGRSRSIEPSPEGSRGYAGHRTDASTGLTYFSARYYDPDLGRWTAPDFLFETLSANIAVQRDAEAADPYLYNLNNPVFLVDTDGREGDAVALKESYAKADGFESSAQRTAVKTNSKANGNYIKLQFQDMGGMLVAVSNFGR